MADPGIPNLQTRLILLVVLAFLPTLGLFWFANSELRRFETRAQENDLLRTAQVTSADYNRLIEESRSLLYALAQVGAVRNARMPECNELLGRVLQGTPRYTTISVIGPDGYLTCGALSVDGGLYLGDRAYVVRATSNKRFAVGDYQMGRITGKPGVGVAHPMLNDAGEVAAVLGASIDLSDLVTEAMAARFPEGASFTVLDRNGVVLVRHPEGTEALGGEAGENFPAMPGRDVNARLVTGTDLDGTESVFAIAPLRGEGPSPEGYLAVGLPQQIMAERLARVRNTQLTFLAVGAVFLLVAAWAFGHFHIVKKVSD